MGANRKKLIILGLLVLALVIVWMFVLRGPSPQGPKFTIKKQAAREPDWLSTLASLQASEKLFSYDAQGRRDPMVPLIKKPRGRTSVIRRKLPKLSLSGIIWDEHEPMAIINRLPLKENETIEGVKVLKVERDRVVLLYGSETFVRELE